MINIYLILIWIHNFFFSFNFTKIPNECFSDKITSIYIKKINSQEEY